MKAPMLPVLLVLACWPLSVSFSHAQPATAPTADPHHHLLLENDGVRLFALTRNRASRPTRATITTS